MKKEQPKNILRITQITLNLLAKDKSIQRYKHKTNTLVKRNQKQIQETKHNTA